LARDVGWLIPVAVLSAGGLLVGRRRRPRNDPIRAGAILWGTWLAAHVVAFSAGSYLNSYYTAAVAPAVAALCGIGVAAVGRRVPRLIVGVAVSASAGYAIFLVPAGTPARPWLVTAALAAVAVADAVVLLGSAGRRGGTRVASVSLAVAAVSALVVPAATSAIVVADGLGPFDTPFEPATAVAVTQIDARRAQDRAARYAQAFASYGANTGAPILFVTETSAVAAPYILASGREVLAIGGFTGAGPAPTLRQIQADIRSGRLRLAVLAVQPANPGPRTRWLATHCRVAQVAPPSRIRFAVYDCSGLSSDRPT